MSIQPPPPPFAPPIRPPSPLRQKITAAYRRLEPECLAPLMTSARFPDPMKADIRARAEALITGLRARGRRSGVEGLVQEYALSSAEGVALMCLAEALLRIPDAATRDALIRDKIAKGDWRSHLGEGRSLFVNAATWGLVVTGKLVSSVDDRGLAAALTRLVARAGEPVIRTGVDHAMRLMGEQFVTGETIEKALTRARDMEARGYRYSYDMLGEAAMTADDAQRYFNSYRAAIHAIGRAAGQRGIYEGPGISIKLSALHPRYSRSQADRVMSELLPRLQELAGLARHYDIGLNIDAEEMDRLELSLDLLESLARDPGLARWDGLGFVVQAYGKRCPFVIDWIVDLARTSGRRIMVRLVKGAYWDAEIKRAQIEGVADFPVYTRKVHTDIAYIACARKLLAAKDAVFPQFATHNAQTVATILSLAGPDFSPGLYEFQCLHGMGEPLYDQVVGAKGLNRPCRIYAPVGTHETLLAYLVRRLLENGANSSFVHQIGDPALALDDLAADPVDRACAFAEPGAPHPDIALPAQLYGDRANSAGIDLSNEESLAALTRALAEDAQLRWSAGPAAGQGAMRPLWNPADPHDLVGHVAEAEAEAAALAAARAARSDWGSRPVEARAAMLDQAADAFQAAIPQLIGLAVREAGKSAANAIAEVREAIDFLRYYASQARATFGPAQRPLGPVLCISPWNFPLAIFTGQIAAALAAGNPVIAKPAETTPLMAAEAVRLLHKAGIPEDALQLMPGTGSLGSALVDCPDIQAVMFTGSTAVAQRIQRQLAQRLTKTDRPIPLIAETGGQNAMIVDSSALPEQVVADVLASAFDSAGQRCSALRLLCVQDDIADRLLDMLTKAMAELRLGPTNQLCHDIGPVITGQARDDLLTYIETRRREGARITQIPLPPDAQSGYFVPPTLIELDRADQLTREVFGPVLHVVRFRRADMGALISAINATGYGLTFGLHSRLDAIVDQVCRQAAAGNIYINRNIIGAVVGVQPFGGRGLSGTGPKAGGPLYLGRLTSNPPRLFGSMGMPDPLQTFIDWLEAKGLEDSARIARAYGEATPLGWEMDLPGPVGERNIYRLHAKGHVHLWPETPAGLYAQMAAVLATGNTGAVVGAPLPADLPEPVRAAFRQNTGLQAVALLVEGGPDQRRQALAAAAQQEGPIMSVYAPLDEADLPYPPVWLLDEQTISINTTAAGGNASLMMLS
ncbi:MAG: bifunctional proline dehydrogenase/L-glutamate gamma-semialdehyde dehydrogenase PutA [Chakrabartia sp.]